MAGVIARGYQPQPNPNAIPPVAGTYGAAVKTQAGDYDNIMGKYNDLYSNFAARGIPSVAFNPVGAAQTTYSQDPNVTSAIGNLKNLSDTGGYSDSDIQNLRARGISPIRSVYASAAQNLDRSRALGGGYSPNYAAASAKMAREQADQIAQQTTNVNAGLAQQIAANKLQATPQFANAAQGEEQARQGIDTRNAAAVNNANEFNATGGFEAGKANAGYLQNHNNTLLDILKSQGSFYGTTPALASLFGNQTLAQNAQNTDAAKFNVQNQQNGQRLLLGGAL